ncbi:MAG: carboxypeptidase-like regulatory domain-containing protein [Planctomycetota bacterium]
MRTITFLRAVVGFAVLLAGAASADALAGEVVTEEPWTGVLPDPEQHRADDALEQDVFAVRVVDAETREPVVGARWVRTPEWIAGWRRWHDAVLSMAVTDALGVASVPVARDAWTSDSHWIVLAEGYAPHHEYGVVPEAQVELHRGQILRGVVRDILGRPVVDARVDVLGGCSHGTPYAGARTGPDGSFDVGLLGVPSGSQLWVEGTCLASDLYATDRFASLGREGILVLPRRAVRHAGVVVDVLGRPVVGAVVRAWNEQRGPAAVTDAEGRFVLEGVEGAWDELQVFVPGDYTSETGSWFVEDPSAGDDLRIVVDGLGVLEPERDGTLVVSVRTPSGEPASDMSVRAVSLATGRGDAESTRSPDDEDDDVRPGEVAFEVCAGPVRVEPASAFSAWTFDPLRVDVPTGGRVRVDVTARARPRLRIQGVVPEGATLTLVVERETEDGIDGPGARPALPADAPAALQVELPDRPRLDFVVGPEVDGERTVTVAVPEPAVIELPSGSEALELFDGMRSAFAWYEKDRILTDARGRLRVAWRAGRKGPRREAWVDISGPGAHVRVGEGLPVVSATDVQIRCEGPHGEYGPDERPYDDTARPGEWVVVRRDGWQTLGGRAPDEGTLVLRWGPARLRLEIAEEDGTPVDAVVLVGSALHAAPEGLLGLHGLPAGPLTVLVARRGAHGTGARLELSLTSDEELSHRVVLR